MDAIASLIGFVIVASAGAAGMAMQVRLPGWAQTSGAVDMLRRSSTILAMLLAVTLGMMTASHKGEFDSADQTLKRFSAQVLELDRTLRRAGPAGAAARDLLFRYTDRVMKDMFPEAAQGLPADVMTARNLREALRESIDTLRPTQPNTAQLREDARQQFRELVLTRWTLNEGAGTDLSPWLIGVLIVWLTLAFAAFGMLAPRNKLVLGCLGGLAAAFGGAFFLMVEYSAPFSGIITVSPSPLENVLFALAD